MRKLIKQLKKEYGKLTNMFERKQWQYTITMLYFEKARVVVRNDNLEILHVSM